MVYTAIQYSVGCGDVTPFVSHNAFTRWNRFRVLHLSIL